VLRHGAYQPTVALNQDRASREPATKDVPRRSTSRPALEHGNCKECPYLFTARHVHFLPLLRNPTLLLRNPTLPARWRHPSVTTINVEARRALTRVSDAGALPMTYRSVATWSVACAAIGTGAWLVFGNGLVASPVAQEALGPPLLQPQMIVAKRRGRIDARGGAE